MDEKAETYLGHLPKVTQVVNGIESEGSNLVLSESKVCAHNYSD